MRQVIRSLSILSLCLAGCGDDGGGGGGDSTTTGTSDSTSGGSGTTGGGSGSGGTDDGGSGTGDGGTQSTGSDTTGTSGGTGSGTTSGSSGTTSGGTGTTSGDTGTTSGGSGTTTGGSGTTTGGSGTTSGGSGTTTGGSGTTTGNTTPTTGGSTTTSAPSTTTGGGLIPCDTASATLEPIPPNIMLVLDKSGSMVDNTWDHDGQPGTPEVTRWYSLFEVVEFIVTTFNTQINFGAILFPSTSATPTYNEAACLTSATPEVPVAAMNQDAILNGIPPKTAVAEIKGGTPAERGLSAAVTHLNTLDPANPPAMILVTDGAANCEVGAVCQNPSNCPLLEDYDPNLTTTVSDAWLNDGIPTYVVGIDIVNAIVSGIGFPDVNTYEKLNELAPLGGKPKPGGPPHFYQTTNQGELQAALQQIIDDTLSCVVELDPQPPEPENMAVFIGGVEVPEITDCATEDGWMYVPPNPPWDTIELCGTACDDLKAQGDVYIEYYCTPG